MEAEDLQIGNVHHGHNIKRTRIEKRIKQEALSELVHLSQSAVSKYEHARVIDDEMLQRFAKAMDVPFDYLRNLEENAPMMVFENNTVTNNNEGEGVRANTNIANEDITDSSTNTFNPLDKVIELYERMLKDKDEKYAALERRIQSLELNSLK